MTSDFLFAVVVDGVFMSSEVVTAAEDCVAGFASGGVCFLALLRTGGFVGGDFFVGGGGVGGGAGGGGGGGGGGGWAVG